MYNSFLVRCWTTGDAPSAEQRMYHVAHFQTGEHVRTADLHEIPLWVAEHCQTRNPASRLQEDGGHEPAGPRRGESDSEP